MVGCDIREYLDSPTWPANLHTLRRSCWPQSKMGTRIAGRQIATVSDNRDPMRALQSGHLHHRADTVAIALVRPISGRAKGSRFLFRCAILATIRADDSVESAIVVDVSDGHADRPRPGENISPIRSRHQQGLCRCWARASWVRDSAAPEALLNCVEVLPLRDQ
jgi:hypothetical protein